MGKKEGVRKLASLSVYFSIPEEGIWIDGQRFVYTRVDEETWRAQVRTHEYFGGIEFIVSAVGKTIAEATINLVGQIVSHAAYDKAWKQTSGMKFFKIHSINGVSLGQHEDYTCRVMAQTSEEARERIENYDETIVISNITPA